MHCTNSLDTTEDQLKRWSSYFTVKIVKYCKIFQAYKNSFQHLELIKCGNVIPKTLMISLWLYIKTERPLSKGMAVSYEAHIEINLKHIFSFFQFTQLFIKYLNIC